MAAKLRTPPSMYYVYVLKIKDGGVYIGYSDDLKVRVKQHQRKWDCRPVYYEAYSSSELARRRERKLKQYGSAWRALKKRIDI